MGRAGRLLTEFPSILSGLLRHINPARQKRRVLQRSNQEEDSPQADPEAGEEGKQALSDSEDVDSADLLGNGTGGASTVGTFCFN